MTLLEILLLAAVLAFLTLIIVRADRREQMQAERRGRNMRKSKKGEKE